MKQTTTELVRELRRIADAVEDGDSLEGHIRYECLGGGEWEVSGAWRIGNSMGQGGVRVLEAFPLPVEVES